jgi:hypothetical protein
VAGVLPHAVSHNTPRQAPAADHPAASDALPLDTTRLAGTLNSMQQQMRQQQLLHHCALPQRAPLLQLQQGRAPRHRTGRLACYARRTVRGTSDTGTSKGSPLKRPADSSNGKARSSKATQVVVKPPATPSPQQRQQHTNSSRGTQGPQGRQQPNKRSALEEFMRTTPGQSDLSCTLGFALGTASCCHPLQQGLQLRIVATDPSAAAPAPFQCTLAACSAALFQPDSLHSPTSLSCVTPHPTPRLQPAAGRHPDLGGCCHGDCHRAVQ